MMNTYRTLNRSLGLMMLGMMILLPLSASWLSAAAYAGPWGFTLVFLAPIVCLASAGFLLLADDDKTIAAVILAVWVVVAMILLSAVTVGPGV